MPSIALAGPELEGTSTGSGSVHMLRDEGETRQDSDEEPTSRGRGPYATCLKSEILALLVPGALLKHRRHLATTKNQRSRSSTHVVSADGAGRATIAASCCVSKTKTVLTQGSDMIAWPECCEAVYEKHLWRGPGKIQHVVAVCAIYAAETQRAHPALCRQRLEIYIEINGSLA